MRGSESVSLPPRHRERSVAIQSHTARPSFETLDCRVASLLAKTLRVKLLKCFYKCIKLLR